MSVCLSVCRSVYLSLCIPQLRQLPGVRGPPGLLARVHVVPVNGPVSDLVSDLQAGAVASAIL